MFLNNPIDCLLIADTRLLNFSEVEFFLKGGAPSSTRTVFSLNNWLDAVKMLKLILQNFLISNLT